MINKINNKTVIVRKRAASMEAPAIVKKHTKRIVIQKRMLDLLVKEDFRRFAEEKGISEFCIIDMDGYCEAPDIMGCFQRDGKWVVYETGDQGDKLNEAEYGGARDAFVDLAKRNGCEFSPSKACDKGRIFAAVYNLQKVVKNMKGSGDGKQVKQDMIYLQCLMKSGLYR